MFNKKREQIDRAEQLICCLIILNRNIESELKIIREERKKMQQMIARFGEVTNPEKVQKTYV